MAGKKKRVCVGVIPIPQAEYGKMVDVMKQLAMRDVKHEAAVMRIANAGGINPVIEYVKMMRVYQKKHKK